MKKLLITLMLLVNPAFLFPASDSSQLSDQLLKDYMDRSGIIYRSSSIQHVDDECYDGK
jgi:hypothetical protein